MRQALFIGFVVSWCLVPLLIVAKAAGSDKDLLQGVWAAQAVESNGKAVPAEVTARMRYTFKGDKLFIRGNFSDDREEECSYKIDSRMTPQHLDFTPPNAKKPITAIYEVKGDELKICIRHGRSIKGRPAGFSAPPGSESILIVFKKQK